MFGSVSIRPFAERPARRCAPEDPPGHLSGKVQGQHGTVGEGWSVTLCARMLRVAAIAQILTRLVRLPNDGYLQASTRIWHATQDRQLFKPTIKCARAKGRKKPQLLSLEYKGLTWTPERIRQTSRRLRPLSRNCLGAEPVCSPPPLSGTPRRR